ncbi:transposase [Bradyrhizobium sp. DASA03068]
MTIIPANPEHLGASVRINVVLHYSGSAMSHHPHIHMIVPEGIDDKFNIR